MFVSNTISSRLLVYVARWTAPVLTLMIFGSILYFPKLDGRIEFLVNALVAVFTWSLLAFVAVKLTSLRVITKRGSLFLVRGFRYRAEYADQTLTEVRVLPRRGLVYVQFVFDTEGIEQIENTISQFNFLSNSDKFGINRDLVKKTSWLSFWLSFSKKAK